MSNTKTTVSFSFPGIDVSSTYEGTTIEFDLSNGEHHKLICVDRTADGKAVMLHDKALYDIMRMNPTDTTEGGWEACELRKVLNTRILDMYPEDLKRHMVPFPNGDFLSIPSEENIFGDHRWGCMYDPRNRETLRCGTDYRDGWWLSSVASSTAFAIVYYGGSASAYNASYTSCVRPYLLLA